MLAINNLSFKYKNTFVLQNINFKINIGESIALIGESGCGKSTLLKLVYGLLQPNTGEIFWNEKKLLGPNFNLIPGEKFIKYLPQDFDLQGVLSAKENIIKSLRYDSEAEKHKRINELFELIDLQDFINSKVKNLSVGQQQRVALAKVLAKKPQLLLLDEPFSNIDSFRKNKLRRKLFAYLKKENITTIIATHDAADILSFAEKCIVIKNAKIIAKQLTSLLYQNPQSKYVANFFNEVNEISLNKFLPEVRDHFKVLIYPHEIIINENGKYKAKILNSYFKGNHFLNTAIFRDSEILINSKKEFKANENINFDLDKSLIKKISLRIVED